MINCWIDFAHYGLFARVRVAVVVKFAYECENRIESRGLFSWQIIRFFIPPENYLKKIEAIQLFKKKVMCLFSNLILNHLIFYF